MDNDLKKMREDAIKKLDELDKKRSMKYVVNNLRLKKFKNNLLIGTSIAISLVSAGIGFSVGKNTTQNNDKNISTSYDNEFSSTTLDNAPDEVVVEYLNNSFSKFCDYVSQGDATNANDKINSLRESYFDSALNSYYDYKETNNENSYKEFKKNTYSYENVLKQFNDNLSFSNSIYKYAKYMDGQIYIPYVKDSNIPENSYIDNDTIYVPLVSMNSDDIKALGND